jgi:hypothetical protein
VVGLSKAETAKALHKLVLIEVIAIPEKVTKKTLLLF